MKRLYPALTALLLAATPALADRVSVLVFDASGSMWNRVDGALTRIEVARDVMGDYFGSRDNAVPLSVIAYGHNRRGDCGDIEVINPMGQGDAALLESRLRGLMPRGMTPLTDSLSMARNQIPQTAESADIILVTDGLENCSGDPCALAADLAADGIDIRAHVVGFGLSAVEVEALSCITDQTGGMLFQTNSGDELADALRQVSVAEPALEPAPEPEPLPSREAAFDIDDKAEAGFEYQIRWNGEATFVDYMGFVPQGESRAPSSGSYRTIGGTGAAPNNPATRTAPKEPGMYDLILATAQSGVIARQAIEVVAPSMGFDPIGSVEPGAQIRFTFRAPEQMGERIVIADLDQPVKEHQRYGWDNALAKNGATTLRLPVTPGEYEVRYLNAGASEIMFSRRFGVGIPFEDADLTTSTELATQAALATQGDPSQDDLAMVPATFRLPPDVPQSDVTWDAVPLDPDMSPEAWAPLDTGPVISGTFEPGNWRVTAYAPGEVKLSADVAIFPGQANDFTVQIIASTDEDASALGLEGQWRILAIAPRDAPAGAPTDPMTMINVALATNPDGAGYSGTLTPTALMTGSGGTQSTLDSVTEDEGYLFLTFALPAVAPEPFVASLAPFADGFAGTLAAGANSLPVIFWPDNKPLPPLSDMQDALYGPAPEDHGALDPTGSDSSSKIAFVCADFVCSWTDPASGVSLPLPQGWSVTAPVFETASATQTRTDLPSMTLFGPDGQELRLNPRMWVDSDGTCHDTPELGRLCHFNDGDVVTAMTATMIAPLILKGKATTLNQSRPLRVTLAGVPRDAFYSLRIALVQGEDAARATAQDYVGDVAKGDHTLVVGNVYDISALYGTREYRDRKVSIVPGTLVQKIVLAPVFRSEELTLELPDAPIVAGSGGVFPVTLKAPADFNGVIAVHDAEDRDAPALYTVEGAQMMGAQDQVLPVPDVPGPYEVRFLDMNGIMLGGTGFEAVAGSADVSEIVVTPTGKTQFGTGCFISAALKGPDGTSYTMLAPLVAMADGREIRGVLDDETPLAFEIMSFGNEGRSVTDLMLMAPCERLTLDFAKPHCVFREGDGIVTRECPAPVTFAPLQRADGARTMADAIVQGAAGAPSEVAPASNGTGPEFLEIDLGELDPDQLLDLLFPSTRSE